MLGQFPIGSEHGLIPFQWLQAAQQRTVDNGTVDHAEKRVGVDVARSGDDATVFLLREGPEVKDIEEQDQRVRAVNFAASAKNPTKKEVRQS